MSHCKKKKVGLALCGFGRAGQIHFNGVCKNPRCRLKYIVDLMDGNEEVKNLIDGKLEENMLEDVKVVGAGCFEEVSRDVYSTLAIKFSSLPSRTD